MSSSRDVVLSISLPEYGTEESGLQTVRKLWQGLVAKNEQLLRDTRAILLLEAQPGLAATVSAEIELTGYGIPVHHVISSSWGRCFNDAFLYAVSCDRARYWVHLDDEHVCARPFWNSARAALRGPGAHLWQLQLSDDWRDLPEERLVAHDGFTEVLPHPDAAAKARLDPDRYEDEEPYLSLWPVFSLRPAVHALDHFRRSRGLLMRPFDEDAAWAPLQWRFGLRLEQLGARKGVLDPPAFRVEDMQLDGE
jgi:hypothetical protein